MKPRTALVLTAFLLLALQTGRTQRANEADLFLARKERWAIKTGADEAAASIEAANAKPAKVEVLIRLPRPSELPENATNRRAQVTRYSAAEKTVYTIDADIVRFKFEADDHDFHIVIRDHDDFHAEDAPVESGKRRTMIVEIPDPAVVVSSSAWRPLIAETRRRFTERYHPAPRFTYKVIHARITGVGYFDFLHGQSGVAPNGIELHPLLKIELLEEGRTSKPPRNNGQTATAQEAAPGEGITNGKVWVNLSSGVYWTPGTRYYGKTKRGQYMPEKEAIDAGYRAAHGQ